MESNEKKVLVYFYPPESKGWRFNGEKHRYECIMDFYTDEYVENDIEDDARTLIEDEIFQGNWGYEDV